MKCSTRPAPLGSAGEDDHPTAAWVSLGRHPWPLRACLVASICELRMGAVPFLGNLSKSFFFGLWHRRRCRCDPSRCGRCRWARHGAAVRMIRRRKRRRNASRTARSLRATHVAPPPRGCQPMHTSGCTHACRLRRRVIRMSQHVWQVLDCGHTYCNSLQRLGRELSAQGDWHGETVTVRAD